MENETIVALIDGTILVLTYPVNIVKGNLSRNLELNMHIE